MKSIAQLALICFSRLVYHLEFWRIEKRSKQWQVVWTGCTDTGNTARDGWEKIGRLRYRMKTAAKTAEWYYPRWCNPICEVGESRESGLDMEGLQLHISLQYQKGNTQNPRSRCINLVGMKHRILPGFGASLWRDPTQNCIHAEYTTLFCGGEYTNTS